MIDPDAKKINSLIDLLFKRKSRTKYWILVVNDHFDKTYNFFFNSQRRNERLQSIPMHSVRDYKLNNLETIVGAIRQHTQLTLEFAGFTQERWPTSQRLIQKKRDQFE